MEEDLYLILHMMQPRRTVDGTEFRPFLYIIAIVDLEAGTDAAGGRRGND
jgi:hypothetical protein